MNILVFNANAGQFPIQLRKKYPSAKILCCEYFEGYEQWLQNIGFETCRCYKYVDGKKILDFGVLDGMKFDLVCGNPPYQDGNQGNYWYKFIMKGMSLLKDNGKSYWIIPSTWTGMSSYNTNQFKLNYFKNFYIEQIDFTVNKYFSVGIPICSIILNRENESFLTKIVTGNGVIEVDMNSINALPKNISIESIRILNKIIKTNAGKTFSFKEDVGANKGLPKVFVLNSRFIGFNELYVDMTGDTNHTWKISMILSKNDIGALSVFKSKLGKVYADFAGGVKVTAMNNFPHLDLTRTWTDQEIYEYFNLTDEEIQYIEDTVK